MSTATLRRRHAYCVAVLADPELHPSRRQLLESKLAEFTVALRSRCSDCGRALESPGSIAAGIGPVCAHKTAA